MKTCPTCGNSYSDDLSFCLHDGTKLPVRQTFEHQDHPTEVLRPDTNENTDISAAETIVSEANKVTPPQPRAFQMSAVEPSTRMGCALTIGQVATGLIVVVGLGIVGVFYTTRQNSVAMLENNTANRPPISTTSNSTANSSNLSMNTSNTHALPTPITIPGGDLNAKAVELPQPVYPPAARAVRASGTVAVQVLVDQTGRVVSASAVNGHPLLRAAAEKAARSATFNPTIIDGEAKKVSGVLTYKFDLEDPLAKKP